MRQLPIYFMGFFCLSIQPMMQLLIPLWALSLGASPFIVGLSMSAGAIMPTVFSITSGAIVDRFGTKTILRFSSLMIAALVALYPLLPLILFLILLQLIFGPIQSMNWIFAQTFVAKFNRKSADNRQSGYFGFAVNLGTFVGPLIAGFMWDLISPLASFIAVSVWCVFLWLSVLMLPAEEEGDITKQPFSLNLVLPRWQNYQKAMSLLALPAVVVVIYGTFMRLSGYNIKTSFHVVFLEQADFSASAIAMLFSVYSLAGTFSSLAVNYLSRFFRPAAILFAALAISILPLALTPLSSDFGFQLVITLIAGFGIGITFPLLITLLGNAVSSQDQGLAFGLRSTANYTASVVIPFLFGLCVQVVGLNASFYIIGAMLLLPMIFFVPIVLKNFSKQG